MNTSTQSDTYHVVTDIRDLTVDGEQTWRVLLHPRMDAEQDIEHTEQDTGAEYDVESGQEVDRGTFPVTEDDAGTLAALDAALTASGWVRTSGFGGDTFITTATVARG